MGGGAEHCISLGNWMVSPLGGSEYTNKNCLGFAEGEE